MCQVLELPRSGYYSYKNRKMSKTELERKQILDVAKEAMMKIKEYMVLIKCLMM